MKLKKWGICYMSAIVGMYRGQNVYKIKADDYWRLPKSERLSGSYYIIEEDNSVYWKDYVVGYTDNQTQYITEQPWTQAKRKEKNYKKESVSIVDKVLKDSENILSKYGV